MPGEPSILSSSSRCLDTGQLSSDPHRVPRFRSIPLIDGAYARLSRRVKPTSQPQSLLPPIYSITLLLLPWTVEAEFGISCSFPLDAAVFGVMEWIKLWFWAVHCCWNCCLGILTWRPSNQQCERLRGVMMLFPLPERQWVKLKSLGRVKPWIKTNLCVIGTHTLKIWSLFFNLSNFRIWSFILFVLFVFYFGLKQPMYS
ncbi:unnamed protein product [Cuscuta campestris]|uniref:Uncharacterized protein n=1 Tax=Cuscuta campestris TaxID=132261 RepID=A0A484MAZ1_9ASTE|nr:unnamed protein product [Cuscuta campestris]